MDIRLENQAARGIMNLGKRAKVMLLGTFHFDNPGLDELNHEIDMMTEQRQAEIKEVVRRLEAFRPTKIAVEAPLGADARLQAHLAGYRAGEFDLPASEVYQVGFRLARRLGHQRLYPVDAWARQCDSEQAFLAYLEEHGIHEERFRDQINEPIWWDRFTKLWQNNTQLLKTVALWEYLAYINSDEQIRLSHGIYLAWPDGDPGDYRVADFMTGWWYNRNLRIYANIKRITESPEDRILVIYGSGHLPILRHCVETSYIHELEPVSAYL